MSKKTKKLNPLILYKQIIGDKGNAEELSELYDIPLKEKQSDMPHYEVYEPYYMEQADTLYLPTGAFGYKYALVVVDIHTRRCDAEAMKTRDGPAIVKAFKKIFSRGIIQMPKFLVTDSGSEFKNEVVNDYFSDLGIGIRYARINRHRSVALAEYKNKIIGSNILKIQGSIEHDTGKQSKEWKKYLAPLIELINDNLPEPKTYSKSADPIITKGNKDILPIDTPVRVKLDYPIDTATGKRLHGTFRSGDIRWTKY